MPDFSKFAHPEQIEAVKCEDFDMPGWTIYTRTESGSSTTFKHKLREIPPPNMKGVIVKKLNENNYGVKWAKGGTKFNYTAEELTPVS